HLATLQYKHLGEDIGAKEAREKTAELTKLVKAVIAAREPDSPVYTYLRGLRQPSMDDAKLKQLVREVKAHLELSAELDAARAAARESQHAKARDHFRRVREL